MNRKRVRILLNWFQVPFVVFLWVLGVSFGHQQFTYGPYKMKAHEELVYVDFPAFMHAKEPARGYRKGKGWKLREGIPYEDSKKYSRDFLKKKIEDVKLKDLVEIVEYKGRKHELKNLRITKLMANVDFVLNEIVYPVFMILGGLALLSFIFNRNPALVYYLFRQLIIFEIGYIGFYGITNIVRESSSFIIWIHLLTTNMRNHLIASEDIYYTNMIIYFRIIPIIFVFDMLKRATNFLSRKSSKR